MRNTVKVLVGLSFVAATAPTAHAGGWIADNLIKPVFGAHAAREADKVHEQLGKPLDAAAEAAKAAAAAAAGAAVVGH